MCSNVAVLDVARRQRGSILGESSDDRPRPLPRQKRLQDDDDIKPAAAATRPASGRPSPSALDRHTPPSSNTPTAVAADRRRSPADDRQPVGDDRRRTHFGDDEGAAFRYGDRQHSPFGGRDSVDAKSPQLHDLLRRTPPATKTPTNDEQHTKHGERRDRDRTPSGDRLDFDDAGRSYLSGKSGRSPLDRGDSVDGPGGSGGAHHDAFLQKSSRKKHEVDKERVLLDRFAASSKRTDDRKSPSNLSSRKSPLDDGQRTKSIRQTSPVDSRRTTPVDDYRKTPVDSQQRKMSDSPSAQPRKKGSVVDILTGSAAGLTDREGSEYHEKKARARRDSGSPEPRGRKSVSPSLRRAESTERNPFENIGKSPTTTTAEETSFKSRKAADGAVMKPTRRSSQVNVHGVTELRRLPMAGLGEREREREREREFAGVGKLAPQNWFLFMYEQHQIQLQLESTHLHPVSDPLAVSRRSERDQKEGGSK